MRNPFPAYQWYVKDWRSSQAFHRMSLLQQAAYRNMLDVAWLDGDPPCSLPDDDDELAAISGLGMAWMDHATFLRGWFIPKRGRLWNVKLLELYRGYAKLRDARIVAGKRGGSNRAERQANNGKQSLSLAQAKPHTPVFCLLSPDSKETDTGGKPPKVAARDSLAEEFESEIRPAYPKRDGDQRWVQALSSFRVARRSGETLEAMKAGLGRYARWCEHNSIIGRSSVKQAASFFGKEKCWRDPWAIVSVPATNRPGQNGSVRRLKLPSGRVIDVPPGKRLQFTDAADAVEVYEMPNGTLSVKSGAAWL